jgi:hypothetical protein
MYALRDSFTPEQIMEIKIVAEIDLQKQPVADLVAALHEHSVSRVIFAGGHSQLNSLQEAIAACETEGVEAWLVADFIRTSIARPDFDIFGTRPMLVFRTTPDLSWALLVKHEIMDRLGSFIGLVLAAPLFVIIAAAIRLSSPGPIIFRQARAGKNGKPFTMYKFRSMRTDAEMQRDELIRFNVMSGPVFKLEQDPRVTRIGPVSAQDEPRRTAATSERVQRGHEPRRAATAADLRGREICLHGAAAAAFDEAGDHLPLAGQRPQRGHRLQRMGQTRPRLHRQLVALARRANPPEDDPVVLLGWGAR